MTLYDQMQLRLGFAVQHQLHALEQEYRSGQRIFSDLKREYDSIQQQGVPMTEWAKKHADSNIQAAVLLSKLVGVSGNLTFADMSVPEQLAWRSAAFTAARRVGLANDELGHGLQLAHLQFMLGNVAEANRLLDDLESRNEALRESPMDAKLTGCETCKRTTQDVLIVKAGVFSHRANFLAANGQYENALPHVDEAIRIYRQLGSDNAVATCLNTKSIILSNLNRKGEAVEIVDEAIALVPEGHMAVARINRGRDLLALDRRKEAFESIISGLRDATAHKDLYNEALGKMHLGMWYLSSSEPVERQKAMELFQEARVWWRTVGDRRMLYKVLETLQQIYRSVVEQLDATVEQRIEAWLGLARVHDEMENAEGVVEDCEALIVLSGHDPEASLEGLIRLGHACVKLKRYADAASRHQEALQTLSLIRQQGIPTDYAVAEMELFLSLGQAQRHLNQPEAALKSYQRALQIATEQRRTDAAWRARGNIGLFLSDLGRHEAAIEQLQKIVEYYEQPGEEMDRLRLLGHALVNLAYAQQRAGHVEASSTAMEARRLLSLIQDEEGMATLEAIENQILRKVSRQA